MKHQYQSNYVLFNHLAYACVFYHPCFQLSASKSMKCKKKTEFQLLDHHDSVQMIH